MKRTGFQEEQIVEILDERDQVPAAEVAKRHRVSWARIYGWRQSFGKPCVIDVKHLRRLATMWRSSWQRQAAIMMVGAAQSPAAGKGSQVTPTTASVAPARPFARARSPT